MAGGGQENGSSKAAEQQSATAGVLLGRQASIYSLTMDELQHTLGESGKNFGSMNMDEFINNIWTAEENQAQAAAAAAGTGDVAAELGLVSEKGIVGNESTSLTRQGSLSLPETLCRKTVDQVWSEIHCNDLQNGGDENGHHFPNPSAAPEQLTFGEMTLEDFLVRAGVVREQDYATTVASPAPVVQYSEIYQSIAPVGTNFVTRAVIPALRGGKNVGYHGGIVEVNSHGFTGAMKRDGIHPQSQPQTPAAANYCSSFGNGFGAVPMESPASPISPEGLNQYGAEMSGGGRRKRGLDGPVEKVVERRQRRMIKNRESAARSRARKQAYTVELEAELNQLKEENAHMKQLLVEFERQRKEQAIEEAREKTQAQCKVNRGNELLKGMRRTCSLPN